MAAARELKAFSIVLNLFMALVGFALAGVGVFVLLDKHEMIRLNRFNSEGVYADMSSQGLLDIAAVMTIVTGGVLFFLSVHGFLSVCTESRCMLALYIGGAVLALLLETAILATTISFEERVKDDLLGALDQGIIDQFEGHIISDNSFSSAFDEAQIQFECCGIRNYTDFKSYSLIWFDRESLQIPKSCCKLDKESYFDNDQYVFDDIDCGRIPTVQNAHIEQACYSPIKDWLESRTYLLLGMAIVGIGIEALQILVTFCMLRDISATLK